MDNEKKIEIPFGAFDSELIHQEINIPEGFKAVIDGNKIILTRIESEDERIRKALIEYFGEQCDMSDWNGIYGYQVLAWLEKQGEQKVNYTTLVETGNGGINTLVTGEVSTNDYEEKPADKVGPIDECEGLTDFERTLADICIGWIGKEIGWEQYIKDNADVLLRIAVEKFNLMQDVPFEQKSADSYCQEHCKGFQETGKCFADGDCKAKIEAEQKTATWSKEDEEMLRSIIATCELTEQDRDSSPARHLLEMQLNWLKSLKDKYTWKPSDEQMADLWNMLCECRPADHQLLQDIYYGLKKLREE